MRSRMSAFDAFDLILSLSKGEVADLVVPKSSILRRAQDEDFEKRPIVEAGSSCLKGKRREPEHMEQASRD